MAKLTCNWCGEEYTSNQKEVSYFCSITCSNTSMNKGYWKHEEITEESLRWHYELERLSTREIAKIYKTSKTTISRKLKQFGINARSSTEARHQEGYKPPNKEQLTDLYINKYMSYQEIADLLKVDHTAIPYWLKKHGIPIRKPSKTRLGKEFVEPTEKELRYYYEEKGIDTRTLADIYGVSNVFIKRRFQMYGINMREAGFGKKFICSDGHKVKSTLEYKFDEHLTKCDIPHDYEVRLPFDKRYSSDFLCGKDVYVEIWGVTGNEKYNIRRKKKQHLYKKHGLKLLNIYPDDFLDLENKIEELKRLIS